MSPVNQPFSLLSGMSRFRRFASKRRRYSRFVTGRKTLSTWISPIINLISLILHNFPTYIFQETIQEEPSWSKLMFSYAKPAFLGRSLYLTLVHDILCNFCHAWKKEIKRTHSENEMKFGSLILGNELKLKCSISFAESDWYSYYCSTPRPEFLKVFFLDFLKLNK